jgi:hypothetical protein
MLTDPSVSALPPGSLLSFGMPCLKWKLAGAFKTHWGALGFDANPAPFPSRYLKQTVVYKQSEFGVVGANTGTYVQTMDKFTGQIGGPEVPGIGIPGFLPGPLLIGFTAPPDGSGSGSFGGDGAFNFSLTRNGNTSLSASLVQSAPGFENNQSWEITLSDEYTFVQLEADVDALIEGFDPATVPNQTFTQLAYTKLGDDGTDEGLLSALFAMELIPSPYGYAPLIGNFQIPYALGRLGAAALAAYNTGRPEISGEPPGFAKVVGFISMAGAYCLKTYTVVDPATENDPSTTPIGLPTCVNGSGSCAQFFKVSPPTPYVVGQNTCVILTPNGRCGS